MNVAKFSKRLVNARYSAKLPPVLYACSAVTQPAGRPPYTIRIFVLNPSPPPPRPSTVSRLNRRTVVRPRTGRPVRRPKRSNIIFYWISRDGKYDGDVRKNNDTPLSRSAAASPSLVRTPVTLSGDLAHGRNSVDPSGRRKINESTSAINSSVPKIENAVTGPPPNVARTTFPMSSVLRETAGDAATRAQTIVVERSIKRPRVAGYRVNWFLNVPKYFETDSHTGTESNRRVKFVTFRRKRHALSPHPDLIYRTFLVFARPSYVGALTFRQTILPPHENLFFKTRSNTSTILA